MILSPVTLSLNHLTNAIIKLECLRCNINYRLVKEEKKNKIVDDDLNSKVIQSFDNGFNEIKSILEGLVSDNHKLYEKEFENLTSPLRSKLDKKFFELDD